MTSIIKELYYGNISPYDRTYDSSSEYARQIDNLTDYEEKLRNFLKNERFTEWYEIFESYIKSSQISGSIIEYECFSQGFRLGAKLALEMILPPEKPLFKDI